MSSSDHTGAEVLSSIEGAIARAPKCEAPFSHLVLDDVFPIDVYNRMLDVIPAITHFTPDRPQKYTRAVRKFHSTADATSAPVSCRYTLPLNDATVARLSPAEQDVWSGVTAALHAPQLKDRIFERFAPDLCRRFGVDAATLARMPAYARPTLIRDLSGYWIAPHPDSRAKIVTVQFYLPRDTTQRALGTTLYRRRLFNPRILLSLSNLFEPVRSLDFLPNTGYMFPVGRHSWHGRPEVPAGSGERLSILLVYYRDASREW